MEKKPELCRVDDALHVLTGKWKSIILLQLFHHGTLRFSELKRQLPGITQKMLTNQLRELEEEDLVARTVYPQVPPKVEYSLTDHGKTLEPVLDMMHEWAVTHQAYKDKQDAARAAEQQPL